MLYFRIACFVLLAISASHLAGHYLIIPHFQIDRQYSEKKSLDTNETIRSLMNESFKDAAGKTMSFMDIQKGLSLWYALFFLWLGLINLMMAKGLIRNKRMLSHLCFMNTAMLLIGVVISSVYFFWLPIVSSGIAMIFFVIAALKFQRDF